MSSHISLYYNYEQNGPGKVIQNLTKGLELAGRDVIHNPEKPKGSIGLLQDHQIWRSLSANDNVICGPNLFVIPSENNNLCEKFKKFVCPSKWVYDLYKQFNVLDHASLYIWPVGIDTCTWNNKRNINSIKKNIILYTKNRNEEKVKLQQELHKFNINISIIEYGNYSENQLLNLCSQADGCILLTGTESQGIAYMQILSCGIPCYVIEKDYVNYKSHCNISATSVPYFNDFCGKKVKNFEHESFNDFIMNLNSFDPRSYMLKEHTLLISALKYIDILEICK